MKKPRKKKFDSAPVRELLRATLNQVAREERIGGHIKVSDSEDERDDEDENEDKDEDDRAAPRFTSEGLVASVGPYQPIAGYKGYPRAGRDARGVARDHECARAVQVGWQSASPTPPRAGGPGPRSEA